MEGSCTSAIRNMKRQGESYEGIEKLTGLEGVTIQRVVKAPTPKRSRKGEATKKKLIYTDNLKCILHFVSLSWRNRYLLCLRLVVECKTSASATTLKAAGYRRCVFCHSPLISKKQAAKILAFEFRPSSQITMMLTAYLSVDYQV
jgi:hypothetical protein